MERFEPQAVTHMLVVADATVSRDWYVDVLTASTAGPPWCWICTGTGFCS